MTYQISSTWYKLINIFIWQNCDLSPWKYIIISAYSRLGSENSPTGLELMAGAYIHLLLKKKVYLCTK